MKCEICKEKDAETAITVKKDGADEELYVCRECARKESVRRQKKSQRTKKASGQPPGVTLSVSRVGDDGEPPPPIVEAIMNAMSDFVSDLDKLSKKDGAAGGKSAGEKEKPDLAAFPLSRIPEEFRIGDMIHLEGLHLVGELDATKRAFEAMKVELAGIEADGLRDVGHVYRIRYTGAPERAKRIVKDLVAQERNARQRLKSELPRVFGDSLCRALAVLKNCRLLSPAEQYDLLSPIRIAAREGYLDGLTLVEVRALADGIDLSSREDDLSDDDRDRIDAARADEMNRRFEDVVLSERGEGMFL
ncbi:MAG: hypothetical protein J6U17_06340 [Kiritimatiellae bacterium]|nr:hypothetical protein [Kiritimatiellia bacterium]